MSWKDTLKRGIRSCCDFVVRHKKKVIATCLTGLLVASFLIPGLNIISATTTIITKLSTYAGSIVSMYIYHECKKADHAAAEEIKSEVPKIEDNMESSVESSLRKMEKETENDVFGEKIEEGKEVTQSTDTITKNPYFVPIPSLYTQSYQSRGITQATPLPPEKESLKQESSQTNYSQPQINSLKVVLAEFYQELSRFLCVVGEFQTELLKPKEYRKKLRGRENGFREINISSINYLANKNEKDECQIKRWLVFLSCTPDFIHSEYKKRLVINAICDRLAGQDTHQVEAYYARLKVKLSNHTSYALQKTFCSNQGKDYRRSFRAQHARACLFFKQNSDSMKEPYKSDHFFDIGLG